MFDQFAGSLVDNAANVIAVQCLSCLPEKRSNGPICSFLTIIQPKLFTQKAPNNVILDVSLILFLFEMRTLICGCVYRISSLWHIYLTCSQPQSSSVPRTRPISCNIHFNK